MKQNAIRDITILGILAAAALGSYIWLSAVAYQTGFPLDDAWIHQVYARNLAQTGEWTFTAGERSAGSTAPLWSSLLSIGYLLNLSNQLWAFLLGWILLWAMGVTGYYGFQIWFPEQRSKAVIAGIVLIFEWHLVWAAGSGMETILFALLSLLVLISMIHLDNRGKNSDLVQLLSIGILIGVSVWVRPDGITLLGPMIFVVMISKNFEKQRLVSGMSILLGFAIIFGAYLIFNMFLAGSLWPNTFYAKQQEYAILRQVPIYTRIFNQMKLPLIGVGLVLIPGFIAFILMSIRKLKIAEISGWLWILGFLLMYAIRLPVEYQHGRYVIPVIPVYVIFGLVGLFELVDLNAKIKSRRIASRAWAILTGSLIIAFWVVGARAYAQDVAIIESEMVTTAKWISANTSASEIVAVHDIGAIGFYSERKILDLAGLVSPEVIPIIRNEDSLELFLTQNNVDYLVSFPGWYPDLVRKGKLVFTTRAPFSPKLGGENMAVYKWNVQ